MTISYGYYDENATHRKLKAASVPPYVKDHAHELAKHGIPEQSDFIRYSYADHWTVTISR